MKIINLIENTAGAEGCTASHGLSFYIETAGHKILMDLGPTEDTLKNAVTLGIDLSQVDTVVLSHGHYDHAGGILPFAAVNDRALIYMQASADGDYYSDNGESAGEDRYKYIGIDKRIAGLAQVRMIQGDCVIDEELEIFTVRSRTHELPFPNERLLIRKNGGYVRDGFSHEHFLVIRENGLRVLMSGCAHNGILSIMDAYQEKYKDLPDAVISGFHLMVKREYTDAEREEVRAIARELRRYPTRFYTCHCTGTAAYEEMKEIMGDRLQYVHTGEEVKLCERHA